MLPLFWGLLIRGIIELPTQEKHEQNAISATTSERMFSKAQ